MEQLDLLFDQLSKWLKQVCNGYKKKKLCQNYIVQLFDDGCLCFGRLSKNFKIFNVLYQISIALSATSLSSIHLVAQNDFGNKLLPVTSI